MRVRSMVAAWNVAAALAATRDAALLPVLTVLAVAAVLLGSWPAGAQESHPITVHDMLAMDRISSQTASPDGKTIAFVVRSTDQEANKGRTDIWMVGSDGEGLRRLTSHPASDFHPVWAPHGMQLYFLSTRSGSAQIWQIPVDGGEAGQMTDLPLDVGGFVVSRDGNTFGLSMEVFSECSTLDCTVQKLEAREKAAYSGQVYDSIFVRHWDTWKDGRRAHLFARPVQGGDPIDLMKGMEADTPTKPFGGSEDMTFTPDGAGIVFVAREVGAEEPWSTDFDLWVAPIDGSRPPQCITTENEAWDANPSFSPDGKTLGYTAMARPRYEADRMVIQLRSWEVTADGGRNSWSWGEATRLTDDWDRSAYSVVWNPNSKTIYTHSSNFGQRALFSVNAKNGEVKELLSDGYVRGPVWADGRLVFGRDDLKSPVELHSIKPNGKDLKQITDINGAKVAAARMGDYEQFTFKGWNDEDVYGYVVYPVDFDPNYQYPVAFLIHGGPQGSFGNDFHYRWNPQPYAGAGYAAVMVDFHGSTGYGQEFCDSIRGDWGGKPLEDLQKGLEAALAKYPWMDGERVCALGASFGGYMVNWIAGNWPDRFTCLVNHDGNLDERAAYFMTEELWFPEWDHEGTPWTNPEGYEKHNPVNFVQNWKTPMLVVHGALDYRVVDTSGLSTFNALQRLGIPSRLLYFPDENHWVLKPQNSIQWHDTVIEWIDQWTKEEGEGRPSR